MIVERRTPDPELKLILLYVLSRLGACSDLQLNDLMTQESVMNYFDMSIALSALEREECVTRRAEGTVYIYDILDKGRDTLSMFTARIAHSTMEKLDKALPGFLEKLKMEQMMATSMHQMESGEYEVQMSARELSREILNVRMVVPTAEMAKRLTDSWHTSAPIVYQALVSAMQDTEDA